ncbi:ATP/GTP-binding protein [Adlercreutzia sp. ZJ242]|uniref:AAA family ATPase n=1 Tax=Adlercreutzia sp. ZJ242 TaxID=2709409 RepID=UPI0013EB080C|nr:AAA family ATPase [Adlercreutzia sp. ZJ242]
MKLLKVYFDHLMMFEGGVFEIDLFASDRVAASDESAFKLAGHLHVNSIVALAGINASGKTTALNLLELACRIVDGSPVRGGGLPSVLPTVFDGPSTFKCVAWHEGSAYLVESVLAAGGDEGDGPVLGFAEETVSSLPAKALKRSVLGSWDDIEALASPLCTRAQMPGSWAALTSPDVSIAVAVFARDFGQRVRATAVRDDGFRLAEQFDGLDDVLRVFDPYIEHLEVRDSGRAFVLTFFGREPITLSERGLAEVLSSGTVRGLGLVQRAMRILRSGGYLLVDEVENHLNRQLVNVVLDLFAASETNPKGATLVFTTHYPQLLDHVHRKDNVFFLVRGDGGGACAVKYCDRVRRIENKKSEVFASNFVKGTAPRYADVRALKSLVAERVADE